MCNIFEGLLSESTKRFQYRIFHVYWAQIIEKYQNGVTLQYNPVCSLNEIPKYSLKLMTSWFLYLRVFLYTLQIGTSKTFGRHSVCVSMYLWNILTWQKGQPISQMHSYTNWIKWHNYGSATSGAGRSSWRRLISHRNMGTTQENWWKHLSSSWKKILSASK